MLTKWCDDCGAWAEYTCEGECDLYLCEKHAKEHDFKCPECGKNLKTFEQYNTNKKLIEYWTDDDDESLKLKLTRDKADYDFPSYEDVITYLKETDADGDMEEVMDDLIIQFIDGEFWLNQC